MSFVGWGVRLGKAKAIVDLNALSENFRTIRSLLPSSVSLLCVVKSDAYGHGAKEVSKSLEALGADYLAVSNLDEASMLREWGIRSPILVLSGLMPWERAERVRELRLTPVVHSFSVLRRLKQEDGPIRVHLKLDTGMGRLGFMKEDLPRLIEELKATKALEVEGIMSHFSSSEQRDEFGLAQLQRFREMVETLQQAGIAYRFLHMANTAALLNYPEAYFNMVRIGLALYGYLPSRELEERLSLKRVMTITSKVAFIKEFPAGFGLGYGRTFVTERRTRIAVVPFGYGDGYPRDLSNKGHVLIKGHCSPIVGVVSMDFILVDVTDKEVEEGDEVVLLGDGVDAHALATLRGSIAYELLCNLSKGLERKVREG